MRGRFEEKRILIWEKKMDRELKVSKFYRFREGWDKWKNESYLIGLEELIRSSMNGKGRGLKRFVFERLGIKRFLVIEFENERLSKKFFETWDERLESERRYFEEFEEERKIDRRIKFVKYEGKSVRVVLNLDEIVLKENKLSSLWKIEFGYLISEIYGFEYNEKRYNEGRKIYEKLMS